MSEDFRRRAMQQMMPESTKFDIEERKAEAAELAARQKRKADIGVAKENKLGRNQNGRA